MRPGRQPFIGYPARSQRVNEPEHLRFRKTLESVDQIWLFEFDELSFRLSSRLRQINVADRQRRGATVRAGLLQFIGHGALPCLIALAIKQNHRVALGKELLVVLANGGGVPFEERYLHVVSPALEKLAQGKVACRSRSSQIT